MNKPKFETPNLTTENVTKIAELFPGVVTEGKVNIDLLRSMLGEDVFGDEAYEFTWVGKRAAIAEAGRPIRKTLRPVLEDETTPTGADSTGNPYCSSGSRDWDTTENLYIEGDNLDVLKLLQESYLGKVKMCYIDPPYNTGSDFVYRDNFTSSREDYEEEAGVYDEDGDRLFKNTETNGRFHSDWCCMMYPRLVLARNLLRDDGVIFISIDDNELHNLRKVCDEIFGSANYFGCVSRATGTTTGQDANKIGSSLDYLLIYKKSPAFTLEGIALSEDDEKRFSFEDSKGKYSVLQLRKTGNADRREDRPNMYYPVISPEGKEVFPVGPTGYESRWRFGYSTYEEFLKNDMIVWQTSRNGELMPYVKYYLEGRTKQVSNLWTDVEGNKKGTIDLKSAIGSKAFDNPKPVDLLTKIIKVSGVRDNDLVLDFFSGSATTADAVMRLNAEDEGKRKFIMVQLPEVCTEGTEAAKAGYSTICEIGKERILRAGDNIKAEAGLTAQNLDIGFRVLKLDDTNMNDVYYAAGDYTQELVLQMESNIKPDRTDMDLLYGCLLDWGLPLSMPHTHEKIDGFTIHTYNDGDLIACFDEHISEKAIREIAGRKPLRAVFRDSGFTSSPEKINVFEIFKLLAPNTNVRVI